MKIYILFFLFILAHVNVFGHSDSTVIPIQRQRNHEQITAEQQKCDLADGNRDGVVSVSANEEINLQVTDALFRRINVLADFIETNNKIASNNEKIRQLNMYKLL